MKKCLSVFMLAALGLVATPAHADMAIICINYDVDFDDSDLGGTETYWSSNGLKVADGIQIKLTELPSGTPVLAYANSGGCATFDVDAGASYQVRPQARIQIDGHTIAVRKSSTEAVWAETVASSETMPSGTSVHSYTLSSTRVFNTLGAAGMAVRASDAGLSSLGFDFYTTDTPGGSLTSPCSNQPCVVGDEAWVSDTTAHRKFAVARVFATMLLNEMGFGTPATNADDSKCSQTSASTSLGSIEYQSAAAYQGYKYFHSAASFNDITSSSCSLTYAQKANWDQLAYPCFKELETDRFGFVDCGDGPTAKPFEELLPTKNYRAYCDSRHQSGASLPSDTAVTLDYLRLFVAAVRNGNVTVQEVGELYDASQPNWSTGVHAALQAAAATVGWPSANYLAAATDHGTNE